MEDERSKIADMRFAEECKRRGIGEKGESCFAEECERRRNVLGRVYC